MKVPEAKEIERLAQGVISCPLFGHHPVQRWKVVVASAVGDPRKKIEVFAILRCETCHVKVGVVVTCKRQGYGLTETAQAKKAT